MRPEETGGEVGGRAWERARRAPPAGRPAARTPAVAGAWPPSVAAAPGTSLAHSAAPREDRRSTRTTHRRAAGLARAGAPARAGCPHAARPPSPPHPRHRRPLKTRTRRAVLTSSNHCEQSHAVRPPLDPRTRPGHARSGRNAEVRAPAFLSTRHTSGQSRVAQLPMHLERTEVAHRARASAARAASPPRHQDSTSAAPMAACLRPAGAILSAWHARGEASGNLDHRHRRSNAPRDRAG
eukprot:scaffold6454_cov113-Isochrysis_galbana.AAC.9